MKPITANYSISYEWGIIKTPIIFIPTCEHIGNLNMYRLTPSICAARTISYGFPGQRTGQPIQRLHPKIGSNAPDDQMKPQAMSTIICPLYEGTCLLLSLRIGTKECLIPSIYVQAISRRTLKSRAVIFPMNFNQAVIRLKLYSKPLWPD